MIAYEELEKALARWKARRSNAPEGQAVPEGQGAPEDQGVVQGQGATESQEVAEGPVTAPVPVAADAPGEVHPAYQNPDSTGELDLTDADVSEA